MSRQTIPLKSRVRYEGRVRTFDRRATKDADLEKLPVPIWFTVGQVLRSKFRKPVLGDDANKPKPESKVIQAATSAAAQDR